MSLTIGSRLGPYEILSPLGAGGMGEVYRARDAKLNRDVAIKVLLPAVANDPDRLARFGREAQVLASLNHSNIAHIHGIEESNGVTALVMELVEGEDLSQRIALGPIPIDEALPIARQIAEALEAAHEQGIIHRDLKPANIKVRADGTVKVLDFGLAKAIEPAGTSSANAAMSPTLSIHATQAGIILGTAAYMSPEQARGKAVDKRTDIWAFGVVLFEMLTGRQLYAGDTITDVLAGIVSREPDWSLLPAGTPPVVRRLLARCLEKDPQRRLRDIGEARVALSDPSDLSAAPAVPPISVNALPWRRSTVWAALALVAMCSASLAVWTWTRLRPMTAPRVTRLSIPLPAGQILAGGSGPAVSPDGRSLAYVARAADGVSRLYVRALDRFESTGIPESEGAQQPFFSPDGSRIGFFARGKLLTVSLSGGAPTAIAEASFQPVGGTWGEDETIVFVPAIASGLLRIPSAGGKPQTLTEPDEAAGGYAHVWPQFLPDGRSLLFTIWGGLDLDAPGPALLSLDTGKWARGPSPKTWSSRYARSGHLLASGPHGLTAASFDPYHPEQTRARAFVVDDVFSSPATADSWFAMSDSGTLVYVPGDPNLGVLSWVDREGRVAPIADKAASVADPTLSPDGTRVALEGDSDLWLVDLRRGNRSRLTLENEQTSAYPVWSRDGSRIFFASNRGGDWDLYAASSGGGPATRLLARKGTQMPLSEAPDGTLLFSERSKGTGADLWTLAPDGTPAPFLVSPSSKVGGQFSPDGLTIAYVSDETGRDEVYLRSVARPSDGIAVSVDGGREPMWSPDGKELFYRQGETFLAVGVSSASPIGVGDARKLFEIRAASGRSANHAGYAVSPDGRRFLVLQLDLRAIPAQINVVLNWFDELKARVPTK